MRRKSEGFAEEIALADIAPLKVFVRRNPFCAGWSDCLKVGNKRRCLSRVAA
jgi:hypothetical protein